MTQVDTIKTMLASGEWVEFIARPFPFFVVSLWDECYREYIGSLTNGTLNIPDGLFIQEKDGVVRNFRKAGSLDSVKKYLADTYRKDRAEIEKLIQTAHALNTEADEFILKNPNIEEKEFEAFLAKMFNVVVFGAVLPRLLAESLTENNINDSEFLKECDDLRAVTYYPKILMQILYPYIEKQLINDGLQNVKETLAFILMDEVRAHDYSKVEERLREAKSGKNFVYIIDNGNRSIYWLENTDLLTQSAKSIEDMQSALTVKGQPAYKGIHTGIARLCVTLDGSDIQEFNKGDILISINSSPNLMNWISKAGAIVTDEGGITCHAAIVSRELKIPCIIGTRNATKVIKNGDKVEVDAEKGVVRIIS